MPVNLEELKKKINGNKEVAIKAIVVEEKLPAVIEPKPIMKKKGKAGRPTKFTDEVRKKIEEVASLDGTLEEMAMYSDISRQTLYEYLEADPVFADRINALRQKPILKARNTIIHNLAEVHNAQWYLERKAKKEFAPKAEIDVNAKILVMNI